MRIQRLVLMSVALTAIAMAVAAVQPRAGAEDDADRTAPVIAAPVTPLPTTAPAVASSSRTAQASGAQVNAAAPLPAIYQGLLQRSLFSLGQAQPAAMLASHGGRPDGGGGAEATLVFRGVGFSDDRRSAYIENTASRQITRHHEGEIIAGGRIASLSLDELVYEADGQTKHIRPGQNLTGQVVAPPPPPASQPAQPQTQPGGPQPPGGMQLPPGMTPEQAAAMQRAMMQRGRPRAAPQAESN